MTGVESANIAAGLTAMARERPDALAVLAPSRPVPLGPGARHVHLTFRQLDRESDAHRRRPGRERGIGRGVRDRPDGQARPGLLLAHLRPVQGGGGAGPGRPRPRDQEHRPRAGRGQARGLHRHPQGPGGPPPPRLGQRRRSGRPSRSPPDGPRAGSENEANRAELAPVADDETAAILFTSGSTGIPKGVNYTHAIFRAQVDLLRETYDIRPGEVDLCTFPLFALFGPLLGMTCVVPEMDFTRPGQVDPTKDHRGRRGLRRHEPVRLPRPDPPGRGLRREKRSQTPDAPPGDLRRRPGLGRRSWRRSRASSKPDARILHPLRGHRIPARLLDRLRRGPRRDPAQDRRGARGSASAGRSSGMRVEIIAIRDEPIAGWSDELLVPGKHHRRDRRPGAGRDPVVLRPRRVDAGWPRSTTRIDRGVSGTGWVIWATGTSLGRIWFCGRKSHRVITPFGTMFTIPVEGIFNTHPMVARTALVGVGEPLAGPGRWSASSCWSSRGRSSSKSGSRSARSC